MSSAEQIADLDRLLAEQAAYYRAAAPEYENQGLDLPGGDELTAALDAFRPTGEVDAGAGRVADDGHRDGRAVLLGSRQPGQLTPTSAGQGV